MSTALEMPMASCVCPSATGRRWLAVVSHTDPKYGGLSTAVPRGEREIAERGGFDVSLAAFCAPEEMVMPPGFDADHVSFWPTSRTAWLRSGDLRAQFAGLVRAADAVHIHGLWEASTAGGARAARAQRRPYVLSAHGMLEPWALQNRRLKKLVYARLVERKIVARAACLHALTNAEAAQYRAFGARNPIAVVPNAVDVPAHISPAQFFSVFPQLQPRRLLLFLGRLHPKKGLNLLIEAWSRLRADHRDWHLVIAGPDAEGTEGRLHAAIASQGIEDSVTFAGMLGGAMKWSALAAAEGFVLPSYSEGLSMGVLEALGASLPVVITRNCNLPEVAQQGAGWEIPAETQALTEALSALFSNSAEENKAIGMCGSYLVTARYNPRVIAEQMSGVYSYVLDGILPTNVTMNLF